MIPTPQYLFTSARLGFRNWQESDIAPMAAINADPLVMEFFPAVKTYEETADFVARMQQQFAERRYCYFAVDRLDDNTFIGFIGLSWQTFEADFTPCADIGWRLARAEWGKSYATEGAKRCLAYAFDELQLSSVLSMAPKLNARSEEVMKKIGMQKVKDFTHPLLLQDERLKACVLYRIERTTAAGHVR